MASVSVLQPKKGGFACRFVNEPQEIQSKCSVCGLILREPYQVSCCGNSFCKVCIQGKKKSCPSCNKKSSTFHNKGLQLSLYKFQVYCSHKEEGCEWKGELGQLENHVNLTPQLDKQLEGCKYSKIECIHCSELVQRSGVTVHQTEHCWKRPFNCEHCHRYKNIYEDVINNHQPVCGYRQVQCPNICGKSMEHRAIDAHVTKDCPKTVIDCDFRCVGCTIKLFRKDMQNHYDSDIVNHMSLQAASYKQLQEKVQQLERREQTLREQLQASRETNQRDATRIQQMQKQMVTLNQTNKAEIQLAQRIMKRKHLYPGNTIEIKMENYHGYKRAGSTWYSAPLYSHTRGYKFALGVCANGYGVGRGTHISVIMYLLKGEFDDELQWPISAGATCTIQILKQNKKGFRWKLKLNQITPRGQRVRAVNPNGYGYPKFTPNSVVQNLYLRDNCLDFRIKFNCKKWTGTKVYRE